MKNAILAATLSLAFVSCGASATDRLNPGNHATRPEVAAEVKKLNAADAAETKARIEADKGLQSQITQHGYEINTQAHYTTSVKESLEAAVATQTGINAAQTTHTNAVQDAAQQANVKGDYAHVRLDAAEGAIRETNGAVQSVNADLQSSKATGLAIASELNGKIDQTRADGAVAIGKTNTAVKAVDDKVNAGFTYQNGVNQAQAVNNVSQQAQIDSAHHGIAGNTAAIATVDGKATKAQNTADGAVAIGVVNAGNINTNTKSIGQLGVRADQTDLEVAGVKQVNNRQDVQLGQHAEAINAQAQRWDNQDAVNTALDTRLGGAYQRLDSQQSEINRNKRDIKTAKNMAVASLAVANMHFCTGPECGFQLAAAVANMEGSNAFAIGAGGAVSENVFLNGAFTSSGSVTGVAFGGTYRFK